MSPHAPALVLTCRLHCGDRYQKGLADSEEEAAWEEDGGAGRKGRGGGSFSNVVPDDIPLTGHFRDDLMAGGDEDGGGSSTPGGIPFRAYKERWRLRGGRGGGHTALTSEPLDQESHSGENDGAAPDGESTRRHDAERNLKGCLSEADAGNGIVTEENGKDAVV